MDLKRINVSQGLISTRGHCIVIGSHTHHIVETNKVEVKFIGMLS